MNVQQLYEIKLDIITIIMSLLFDLKTVTNVISINYFHRQQASYLHM